MLSRFKTPIGNGPINVTFRYSDVVKEDTFATKPRRALETFLA